LSNAYPVGFEGFFWAEISNAVPLGLQVGERFGVGERTLALGV
jgi:hypothetical protein